MRKLVLSALLLFSLTLVACGQGSLGTVNEPKPDTNGGGSGIVAGEVEASLEEKGNLVYEYRLKNQTEHEVILKFSSSQRYDYTVSTKDGNELFRFSSVASFLQVEGQELLKQGEELTYDIHLSDLNLDKGDYVLTVWMTTIEGEKFLVKADLAI